MDPLVEMAPGLQDIWWTQLYEDLRALKEKAAQQNDFQYI